jgi:hypothetical protein
LSSTNGPLQNHSLQPPASKEESAVRSPDSKTLIEKLQSINQAFQQHGYVQFRVDDFSETEKLNYHLKSAEGVECHAGRYQTRGAMVLTDHMWITDPKLADLFSFLKNGALVEFAKISLNQPEISIGTVLLNTYNKNEFLERHKDGEYRPDLVAVLLIYMNPTSDNALEIELGKGQSIRPNLRAGDCILLSPQLYHTVHPVESPRKSLLIEFKDPHYDSRIMRGR